MTRAPSFEHLDGEVGTLVTLDLTERVVVVSKVEIDLDKETSFTSTSDEDAPIIKSACG